MTSVFAVRGYMTRERAAISALFFANGYVVGNWAPKIPVFKAALGIDEAVLGLLILAFGLGSLAFMPVVGAVIAREGSRRISQLTALALTPTLLLVTLAPNVWAAALLLALLGGLVGGMDVAMNANAVSVERVMRRAIMSSCHAWWSLGGLVGAASGGVLIARFGAVGHSSVVWAVSLAIVLMAWPSLLQDFASQDGATAKGAGLPPRERLLLPLLVGLVALFCMIPEGAVLDWSALYLKDERGASVEAAGFAFAAYSGAMAIMRFGGDPLRNRLGAVRTLRLSAFVAGFGLLVAALSPAVPVAAAGFAFAGLGIANMVPIAFSAAGNLPGFAPGVALSIVTFMGYSGMLFAPSLIGFVARHTGLGSVFLALPALYVVVLALSHLVRHADALEGHPA